MEQSKSIQTPVSPVNNAQNLHFSVKKLLIGISFILFLAIVIVVGMGYGVKSNKVVNKPIQKTVINNTEGWKIYTNEVANFSISYPSTWELKLKNAFTKLMDENGKRVGVQGDIMLKGEGTKIIIGFGSGFGGSTCTYKGGVLESFKVGDKITYLCKLTPNNSKDTYNNEYKYAWINGCGDCGGLITNNGDNYFISISSNKDNLPISVEKIFSTFKLLGNPEQTNKQK